MEPLICCYGTEQKLYAGSAAPQRFALLRSIKSQGKD